MNMSSFYLQNNLLISTCSKVKAVAVVCTSLVAMLFATSHAYARVYSNGINPSSWTTDRSVFECRMTHEIPFFGDAIFRKRAGERSVFFLRGQTDRFAAGEAMLESKSPSWRHDLSSVELGFVPVKQGTRPLWMNNKNAELLMGELSLGRDIQFTRKAWYAADHNDSASIAISTIGFQQAYKGYLGCLSALLPANFDQLKRSSVMFSGKDPIEPDSRSLNTLEHILLFVEQDPSVNKFYIDGHTSSPGAREDNLELSKLRAEFVAEFLRNGGIPEEQLVVRWHGERYPVASNSNASGRAKNQRVTVRLEREQVEKEAMMLDKEK